MPVNVNSLRDGDRGISNGSQMTASPDPVLRQQRFWHKTGIYALCVLAFGTIALLLALNLITFLWKGVDATITYDDSEMGSLWRNIMMKAWLSRTITLSSLVIRISVAAQAGVCTSMLAALLLEGSGVPVSWVAEVSLIRSSTTGPHHLASVVLQAFPRIRGFVTILILATLFVTTVLSQLCSTALLSDIKSGTIVTDAKVSLIAYGKKHDSSNLLPYQGIDYWATKPSAYPTFAEHSFLPEETKDSFYTGKTIRAMLPLADSVERSLIHTYSGVATVTHVQTVCIRPDIEAKVWTGLSAPMLVGKVTGSPSAQILQDNVFDPIDDYFNCTVPINWEDQMKDPMSQKEWTTGLCRLHGSGDMNRGAFLFLNLTQGEWNSWLDITYSTAGSLLDANNDRSDSVWQHMTSPTAGIALSASLC